MKNVEKVIIPIIVIVLVTMLGIYYISKDYKRQQAEKRAEEIQQTVDSNPVSSEELVYQSTAMLVGKDIEDHRLKFISVDNDTLFEFDYTDRTPILGKHGNYLTLEQIPLGEILDVTYSLVNKELLELKISDDAWTYTDVTRFTIDEEAKSMEIAGSTYKLPKTAIVSYGDELATFMDVTNVDTLTVKGYGRKVCSVIVEKGHGYVRLLNDSYFEGGWIEIGQEIIKQVSEEMLIPVPEGSYHVRLTNRGYAAEEDVTVERDKESIIDLSEVDIKEVAIGHVQFNIIPDYAQLYIDGVITDYEERVALEFGIHKIHVELAGYKSVDINIRVSDQYANVDMTLEKEGSDSSTATGKSTTTNKKATTSKTNATTTTSPYYQTSSSNYPVGSTGQYIAPFRQAVPTPIPGSGSSSSSTERSSSTDSSTDSSTTTSSTENTSSSDTSTTELPAEENTRSDETKDPGADTAGDTDATAAVVSDTLRMYVDSPEGAEIYVDGIYAGISPISFIKPDAGSHVITLSKNGYVTKSYTVSVADDDRDVTLSFSELMENITEQ